MIKRLDGRQQALFRIGIIQLGLTGLESRLGAGRAGLAVVEDRYADGDAGAFVELVVQLVVERVVGPRGVSGPDGRAGGNGRQAVGLGYPLAGQSRLDVQSAAFHLRHDLQRRPVHLFQSGHLGQYGRTVYFGKYDVERTVDSQLEQLLELQPCLRQIVLADGQLVAVAAVLSLHLRVIAAGDRAGFEQRFRPFHLGRRRLDGLGVRLDRLVRIQNFEIGLRDGDFDVVAGDFHLVFLAAVDDLLLAQRVFQLASVVKRQAGIERVVARVGAVGTEVLVLLFLMNDVLRGRESERGRPVCLGLLQVDPGALQRNLRRLYLNVVLAGVVDALPERPALSGGLPCGGQGRHQAEQADQSRSDCSFHRVCNFSCRQT